MKHIQEDANINKSIKRFQLLKNVNTENEIPTVQKKDETKFIDTEVMYQDVSMYKNVPKKHMEFIMLMADGRTQVEAFALTCQKGGKAIKKTSYSSSSRLANQYRQLIDIERNKRLISLEKAKDIAVNNAALEAYNSVFSVAKVDSLLCEIMADTQCSTNDRLRAIDIFNRRFGLNKPATIEVSKPKIGIDLEQEDYQ